MIQQVINSGPVSESLSGSGAPSSTPSNIGDHYIDTAGPQIYVAIGISSSADWKMLVSQ